MSRSLSYFASDVHLGLNVEDAPGREKRFVSFLRSIDPSQTENLFLLGDIFDFWYEYKYVVPKGFARVFAALQDLMDAGVKVCFVPGNHDVWTYHYFEDMGMKILPQPSVVEISGRKFCLAHGDCLGPVNRTVRILHGIFHSKFLQALFSTLHPRIAFGFGTAWSKSNRLKHTKAYAFRNEEEPIYKFAASFPEKVDYFVFGHFHVDVRLSMPDGAGFFILKDWFDATSYAVFDADKGELTSFSSAL